MVLPINHYYKKRREDFFVGKVERDVAPLLPLVEELYDMVSFHKSIVFGFQSSKKKFLQRGLEHM
jgi:hypothetical protein